MSEFAILTSLFNNVYVCFEKLLNYLFHLRGLNDSFENIFILEQLASLVWDPLNSYQPRAAFHIGTSHLICSANQVTGFCMKCNPGLKWVKVKSREILPIVFTFYPLFAQF